MFDKRVINLKKLSILFAFIAIGALSLGAVRQYMLKNVARASIVPEATADQQPRPTNMVQYLKQLADNEDPSQLPYLNGARADHLADEIGQMSNDDQPANPNDMITVELQYANELLNAGRTDQAISEFNLIDKQTQNGQRAKQFTTYLTMQKATAYLRLGEQQNCCSSNNSDSCLIPISGKGIHTIQYGSRHAIACLMRVLQAKPTDLTARWLLNIAYMTVGEYPNGVPPAYRIDPKVYGAEYAMKKFYNAAPDLGLAVNQQAGGVAMEDFEGNGRLDLMISTLNIHGQLRYFRNNGDGTFTDRTKEAGLTGEIGGLNIITGDYNNDGKPDVLVLRGGWFQGATGELPVSLLRNNGDGTFTDVTIQSGLIKHMRPTQTAVWFDYNGDGWLDLFIGNEGGDPNHPHYCELYRNNRDGTFTEVSGQDGLYINRFVKAVISADYDHDGRPDLYLSCADGPNILLHNDGPTGSDKSLNATWRFTDVAHQAGVDKQNHTFSCFFFDYDNDGWPDLYVNGYGQEDVSDIAADYLGLPATGERSRLYHNNHDGTFTDVTKQAHLYRINLGMGINFGDLDNDGWLDFYVGTGNPNYTTLVPKRMYRNNGGKYFQEVTTTGDFGHLQKGHGIAFGDINNNGQDDVFIELGGAFEGDTAHSALFVNPGNHNHWVTLKLEGVQSNKIAIGAETCVTVSTPHGDRNIYETVGSGGSFGCNPFRQHFGLGDATAIKQVTIHWPASGITQVVKNVGMDKFWKIREGDTTAQLWNVKSFPIPHGYQNTAMEAKAEARALIVN